MEDTFISNVGSPEPVTETSGTEESSSRHVAGTSRSSDAVSRLRERVEEPLEENSSSPKKEASGERLPSWRRFANAWKSKLRLTTPAPIAETKLTEGVVNLINYEEIPCTFMITNDGFKIEPHLRYHPGQEPRIVGSRNLFPGQSFSFCDIQLHWSDEEDSRGVFAGKPYDVEVHLIHFNRKYGTFKEALEHKDGVLVFGLPFVNDNKGDSNKGIKKMAKCFLRVAFPPTAKMFKSIFNPFNLSMLVSNPVPSVYHFEGPLILETRVALVNWIVLPEPKCISNNAIASLRNILVLLWSHEMQSYLTMGKNYVTENDLLSV